MIIRLVTHSVIFRNGLDQTSLPTGIVLALHGERRMSDKGCQYDSILDYYYYYFLGISK